MAAHVQDVFMLFGDSITQGAWEPGLNGFGERLSHVYARKLDILNRGLSGYNTDWGIPVFEQCFAKHTEKHAPKVRILTIWFGANDACIKPSPQHVPLPKFIENLKHIIDMVHSPESAYYSPFTRILLITPPPINTHQRKADLESRNPPLPLDRLFDITKAYADAVKDVAVEKKVALVDVWSAVWEAAGKEEKALARFLNDGLHLNGEGYAIMYNELVKTIAEIYPEVHYDKLGYVFPPWLEINWDSPADSLYVVNRESA
ncbi:SGNH hydrolase-type esterase domain-containing protein [Crucibulum laeve]|uniref:SGNH hydrolase-type esterase domain-containing protein n=1 Tax=Crucibulum laeve TaxID=68775 RepID=A0A5C3MCU1_9AGAR|nr:SGNH hydrolase-type esterase domain-containing protein [Crucibulum laeve]